MANEPGGTKFAQLITEIDLDRSKYDKKLDESVEAANLATIKIERAFKQLGVRTDASYEQQRVAITTFYKKIINDANASANERAAAEQMLARKIEAINNRQYSALNSMRQAQVKAEEDAVKQRDQLWTNMGVRSNAAINAQKKQVMDSYNQLAISAQGNHSELVRLEAAKNEKIRRLDEEMFGRKSMSWAGLTRDVLRAYAAYYVLSQAIQYIAVPFEKGFKAVETFNTSIASMSAMVVSFSERTKGMSLADQWQQSLTYSKQLIPVLENIAAKTLLSGEETTALANAFARSGVFINANNAAQIEGFTRISNALPLMTQGQEIMRQINTEIRGLMTGQNEQSSMMLITLKAIDPEIENHLRIWRAQGTVMENVGKLLEGFGPATSILENQWQAVKSTIDTTATQILRGAMRPAYEEIIELTKTLNKYLIENKDNINEWSKGVQERFQMIKGIVETITPVVKIVMGSPYRPASEPTWIDPHSVRPAITPKPGPLQPTKEEIEKEKKLYEERKRNSEQAAELIAKLYDQSNKKTEENMKWFDEMEKKKLEIAQKAGDAAVSQYNQIIDLEKNQLDEREKNSDTYKKMWADEADFGTTENERAINKIISDYDMKVLKLNELQEKGNLKYSEYMELMKKYNANKNAAILENEVQHALKIAEIQASIYSKSTGKGGVSGEAEYEATVKRLQVEVKEYEKLGVSAAAVAAHIANTFRDADIKKLRTSGNFFDGVKAGYLQMNKDALTFSEAGFEIFESFAKNVQDTMSNNLFKVLKGDFEGIGDLWDSLFDSMLKKLTDTVSQMATQWAMNLAASAINPYASMAGSAIAAGASWLWDYAIGFAEGAYEVNRDMITKVHAGEMIIPADLAALLREGSGPSPGEAWSESAPAGLQMGATNALDYALDTFGRSFMESIGRAALGKELGSLAMIGQISNPIGIISTISSLIGSIGAGIGAYGQYSTFANIAELAVNGPALSNYDVPSRSFSEIMAGLQEAMAGLFGGGSVSGGGWTDAQGAMGGPGGEPSGESHGDPSGDMGGPGGEPGWKYGGISYGPDTGYMALMHGIEAHVPLPNGKSIPVEMKKVASSEDSSITPIQLKIEIPIVMDGREIGFVIADQTLTHEEMVKALRKAVNVRTN